MLIGGTPRLGVSLQRLAWVSITAVKGWPVVDINSSDAQASVLDSILSQSRSPVKAFSMDGVRCPACGGNYMEVEEYVYHVPYFDKISLTTGSCSRCGYRFRDVRLVEGTDPKKIVVEVRGEEELRYLVARSPLSSIKVPERRLEMVPSSASLGFITTIEGVLMRFLEVAIIACRDKGTEVDEALCRSTIEWLERAIEGREGFTLIICDYDGLSRVIGERVSIGPLDDECRKNGAGPQSILTS